MYILGCVYCKPGTENDYLLDTIYNDLSNLCINYNEYNFVIGGDWNARVGDLNSFDKEMFEGTNLSGCRSTLDPVVKKRGEN